QPLINLLFSIHPSVSKCSFSSPAAAISLISLHLSALSLSLSPSLLSLSALHLSFSPPFPSALHPSFSLYLSTCPPPLLFSLSLYLPGPQQTGPPLYGALCLSLLSS